MLFGLTETQQTLKNTVRKFLAAECPLAEVRKMMDTETGFDSALWTKIAEQGWTGIIFPEEHGGFGMGMVEMVATSGRNGSRAAAWSVFQHRDDGRHAVGCGR